MRRKTIGRNPLDQLDAPRRKGKKRPLPSAPEMQSEIREALTKKPISAKKSPITKWFESVLHSITG
jgi:hypothetical protein